MIEKLLVLPSSNAIYLYTGFMILVTLISKYYKSFAEWYNWVKTLKKVPAPNGSLPIVGHSRLFHAKDLPSNERIHSTLVKLSQEYENEGIFRLDLGLTPNIFLCRPETMAEIISSSTLIEKSSDYVYFEPWLGKGIITADGKTWKPRRKLIMKAFNFKILDDFVPIMNEHSNVLTSILAKNNHEDILLPIMNCALDIICETSLGIKIDCQSNPEIPFKVALKQFNELVFERSVSPWYSSDFIYYLTKSGKKSLELAKEMHSFTRKVVENRRQEMLKERESKFARNDKRMAFLDLLLNQHFEDNSISLEDIREEVDTFTFAGHDTTGSAVTWTLFEIGHHEEVQRKLHEEIDDVFGDDRTSPITNDELKKLHYLEWVIKEGLRLYPSTPFIGRYLTADIEINGYKIPKGTDIWILIAGMQMNKQIYPEPEKFIPERFSPEQAKGRHPYAYLPFVAGPRNCLGQKFAIMEEKIIIANILRNYRIKSLDARDSVTQVLTSIVVPKQAIRIDFTPRMHEAA